MLNWTGRVFNKKDYELLIERALVEWSAWGEEEFNTRFPSINEASIRKLNYVRNRFGQTFGSAHQESRRLDYTDFASGMFSRSTKTGNVLSMIESQGFSK
jgi:hypothetical protein